MKSLINTIAGMVCDLDCSIRNLGRLGKEGMNQTDDMILDIMTHKRN